MEKRLIINADDFGLSANVNAAIAQSHSQGVLTSATLMANMPGAEDAVRMTKQMRGLGVGVHLNLIEGKPISKEKLVRCLLNEEGEFAFTPARLAMMSLTSSKVRLAIQIEMASQLQWVIDHNIRPTHIDSHKHVHSFPLIYPTVCGLAKLFDIEAVRWTYEPVAVSNLPWPLPSEGGKKKANLIRKMARINRIQSSKLLKTDGLLGIAHCGKISLNYIKDLCLYNPLAVAELMTHPGLGEDKNPVMQRQMEFETLCSDKAKEYLAKAKIKLVHYGQLQ